MKLLLLRARHQLFHEQDAFPPTGFIIFDLQQEEMNKLVNFVGHFVILTSITFYQCFLSFKYISTELLHCLFLIFISNISMSQIYQLLIEHSPDCRCDVYRNAFKKRSNQEAADLQLDFNLLVFNNAWIKILIDRPGVNIKSSPLVPCTLFSLLLRWHVKIAEGISILILRPGKSKGYWKSS